MNEYSHSRYRVLSYEYFVQWSIKLTFLLWVLETQRIFKHSFFFRALVRHRFLRRLVLIQKKSCRNIYFDSIR